jgi:UDP-N-acetylmuramate dehydrogenase
MLTTHNNFSLKAYNSFGIDATAAIFYEAKSVESLKEAIKQINSDGIKFLVLGGGSNVLFTKNYEGAVIHPLIGGIELVSEDEISISLRVGAGVEWDFFVDYTVNRGLCGLENLSLIPGSVGASPIQNIGAYGVEAKDCIDRVEGVFTSSLEHFSFDREECKFGYRDSIFKNSLRAKVVVTHVVFKLSKSHNLITHYGNLDIELERIGGRTLENVRQAVISIRNAKLPDPKELGNAGSFFKNPVVDITLVEEIQKQFDKVPFYPVSEGSVKLPAGWLIEQCGWKGKRVGNVGVHKDQALVIVNYCNATGREVIALAHKVRQAVMEKFNVSLEMEVNVE